MTHSPIFCSENELGNLVVSSGLLQLSFGKILDLCREINSDEAPPLRFKICAEAKRTIVAFAALPSCRKNLLSQGESLVSSSTLLDESSVLGFLCSKTNPSFSIHSPAKQLFDSVFDQLSRLKSDLATSEKPLIITGYALGGSVAAIFTLWLLENLPSRLRPLCITFGSPLIGDTSLLSILDNSIWKSCFLHVAAVQDPFPKLLLCPNPASHSVKFEPFGTFLLVSESGCACLDTPEAISELLVKTGVENSRNRFLGDEYYVGCYQELLRQLKFLPFLKRTSQIGGSFSDPLQAGIFLQLEATGIATRMPNTEANALVAKMAERKTELVSRKLAAFDPNKKLNKMKQRMIYLEWYKNTCREKQIGYYDSYKSQSSQYDRKIASFKKELNNYWESMVLEAMKKPQSERAAFRTRWLYAGTNYRRMVEPLEIAEHYSQHDNPGDYLTNRRSQHFVQLEKWLEGEKEENERNMNGRRRKQNLKDLLTMDSCFWAHLEEALVSCETLNRGNLGDEERIATEIKLIEFEGYVMRMIENCEVSPEIFLPQCSFYRWWSEYYEKRIGANRDSELVRFMKNRCYASYGKNEVA